MHLTVASGVARRACHRGDRANLHGIPLDALDFYEELAAENTRAWWQRNKDRYAASVRGPWNSSSTPSRRSSARARLPPEPRRAVQRRQVALQGPRGALVTTAPGMGWYVQVSAGGLVTGGGFHPTGPDQLARLRAAVDAPASGTALERVVAALRSAGFELAGDRVATRPRGVPADHPRLELMRFKTLFARRDHGAPAWLSTPDVVEHVRADWRAVRPLVEWLTEHVGATEQPRPR